MIVIGGSLGGLEALQKLLGGLPASFPEAIAVVLHRHRETASMLAPVLKGQSSMPITEVEDKEPIKRAHVYLAPPDYHLLVEDGHFSLSTDDAVNFARPSIDVLFESAAELFRSAVIGIILTGGSLDGAKGCAQIKRMGGKVIVQDPDDAQCSAMPLAALKAVQADYVKPVDEIPALLFKLTNQKA